MAKHANIINSITENCRLKVPTSKSPEREVVVLHDNV